LRTTAGPPSRDFLPAQSASLSLTSASTKSPIAAPVCDLNALITGVGNDSSSRAAPANFS